MRILFILTIALSTLARPAKAQFYTTDQHSFLLLTDQMGRPVQGAAVRVNGRPMRYFDTCRFFSALPCYSATAIAAGPKILLEVSHPDYFPLRDSLATTGSMMLTRRDRTDFYYADGVRKPYRHFPDHYFVRLGYGDSVEAYAAKVRLAGGEVLRTFPVCSGWKGEDQSPDAMIVCLPQDSAGRALLRVLYARFNTGPILSFGEPADAATGFVDYFTVSTRREDSGLVRDLLRNYVREGMIAGFGAADGYSPGLITIKMAPGREGDMIRFIGILLREGCFSQPQMHIYQYACPG